MKLDFSALREPVSTSDIAIYAQWRRSSSKTTSIWGRELSQMAIGAAVLLLICLYALTLGAIHHIDSLFVLSESLAVMFYILTPTVIIMTVIVIAAQRWKPRLTEKAARQYKFAVRNNLIYNEDVSDPVAKGMIFGRGRLQRLIASYTFPDGMQIGNYRYLEQSGRYEEERKWGFASMPLPRNLPHMLLDSNTNNLFGGQFSNLPETFKGQRMSLEGDFDQYFTLYAPIQYERDALYIFTPDVMAALIDMGHAYDIEVIDDRLIFYREGFIDLEVAHEISEIITMAETIRAEVFQQARRYSDARAGGMMNTITSQGSRLSSKKKRTLLEVGVAVYSLAIILFMIIAFLVRL